MGRLSTRTIARGTYKYDYDATTGKLSSITAPNGDALTYTYDGPLPTNSTWSGTVMGAVSQTYDNDFRIAASSVNGSAVTYGYDADSLLTQVGGLTLTRDPQKNGLLAGPALGRESETFSYNGFGELTGSSASINGTTLLDEQYIRDQLGRITQNVETIGGSTTTVGYFFHLGGRLIQVQQNGTTTATYTYDSNSNRLSVNRNGVIINGVYDAQDRMIQYGDVSYSYTANGELQNKKVSGETTTYNYEEVGNLLSVSLPNGTFIQYVIDGQNRRIGRTVGNTRVQGFLYRNWLNPVAELDGANNVVSRFVYASRGNVPDYMIKNGITYRIITDQLGSPRLVVDVATGTIAQRMDYDEFGRVMPDTNPGFQPFGFAGGIYDLDTHLIRFGARDYDPESGRWTARDPILFAGHDIILYTYSFNDPINVIDPLGLDVIACFGNGTLNGLVRSNWRAGSCRGCSRRASRGCNYRAVYRGLVGGVNLGIDISVSAYYGRWDRVAYDAGSVIGASIFGGAWAKISQVLLTAWKVLLGVLGRMCLRSTTPISRD
jgi:RHS repeat-associated protein